MGDHKLRVLLNWSTKLAPHLGRSVDDIRRNGLTAGDFPRTGIAIRFEDGSEVRLRYAFALQEPGSIAVFTEHNGYLEFPFGPGDELSVF